MNVLVSFLLMAAAADLRPIWNSLVDAERTFARTSVAKGTREAFLNVLADDSVIFRPTAVAGRKWFQENPVSSNQLNWAPEFADIASSGDLGYTTGPWEVRRTAQDPAVAFGHYVTLWRKQDHGEWKVILDDGISHEQVPLTSKTGSPQLPKEISLAMSKQQIESRLAEMIDADKGASMVLADYFDNDVRLYRDGSVPFLGKTAAIRQLSASPNPASATKQGAFIANSGDFGCTYGTTEKANYVRLWKRQSSGSWKIVLDLLSPTS
jgi:ketosteroid isomerase-like protein